MNKQAIFTVAVLFGVAACGNSPYTLTDKEHRAAELGAKEYAANIGAQYVSCSGNDTQRVSYTTCTLQDRQSKAMISIRCTYGEAIGCKPDPQH